MVKSFARIKTLKILTEPNSMFIGQRVEVRNPDSYPKSVSGHPARRSIQENKVIPYFLWTPLRKIIGSGLFLGSRAINKD